MTPTIVFVVKDASGNDLSAVRVTMDGQPLVDVLDGSGVPADLGMHKFEFRADGMDPVEKDLVLHEADRRRERIVLRPRSGGAPPGTEPSAEHAGAGTTQRILGVVVGAVGVVGIGIGIATGVAGQSKHDTLSGQCPNNGCPLSLQGDASTASTR